jgi:hypothetical protein
MLRLSLALLLLAAPASATAQDLFTPHTSGLKHGQKVRILLDAECGNPPCPREVVKGRVTDLTATSIVVADGRKRHELQASRIQFVERSKDRIWNGVLIGFAAGFSLGFVSVLADGCSPGEWCLFDGPSFGAAVGLLTGGIGAGVGALTDAAISRPRVVFARTTPQMAKANAPHAPLTRGIRISVRF